MRTKKSALVVVCLFLGLSTRLDSQTKEQNKKVSPTRTTTQAISDSCATDKKPKATIDLCPSGQSTQTVLFTQEEEEFRDLSQAGKPDNSIWVGIHADIVLSISNRDQVAWTCKSQPFKITGIKRIQHTGGPQQPQPQKPPPPADFPFCSKERILQQQPAGATLYSGVPVAAAKNQCYIYTFELEDGRKIDPHLIVTDPTTGSALDHTKDSDTSIKCDFGRRMVRTNPSKK